jgi:hypothetical protein
MGMLIQTKGTLYLASFFNNRIALIKSGTTSTLIETTLAASYGSTPLYYISEALVGHWPVDGSDVFYPTTTVATVQALAAGGNSLSFTGALPASVVSGQAIWDQDRPGAIPAGATIGAPVFTAGVTAVPLLTSTNANIAAGNTIVFSNPSHPNLIKRWKYYLQYELSYQNHLAIQAAINQGVNDSSITQINFQSVESQTQSVSSSVEYQPTNTTTFPSLNKTQKYLNIVLETPLTKAPDPQDPQF